MKFIKRCINKAGIILPVLALCGVLAIGGTYAWNQYNLLITNELKADTVTVKVVEKTDGALKPEGDQKKQVLFTNTGTSSVFLRMTYTEYWEKEGQLLPNTVDLSGVEEDAAIKNWSSGFNPDATTSDWFRGDDGWYYYRKLIKAGDSTSRVLESVSFPDYTKSIYSVYAGADYYLYFKSEVVQASDGSNTMNSSTVNWNATHELFDGMTATAVSSSGAVTWGRRK